MKDEDISKFDCGAAVNGLVNAGWSKGLGSVINSQGIMQSPVVRKYAKIPDDQVIMICVAMGYPDDNFPANKVVSKEGGLFQKWLLLLDLRNSECIYCFYYFFGQI